MYTLRPVNAQVAYRPITNGVSCFIAEQGKIAPVFAETFDWREVDERLLARDE